MTNNKKAFIFIGPSGSGKGTQVELLKEYLKEKDPSREILHYDAGKSLREYVKTDNYMAGLVNETMISEGGLLPIFITIWNWSRIFANDLKEDMNLIMDGSPRKHEEKKLVDDALQYLGYRDIYVIYLKVNIGVSVKRLMSRGRVDDTEENIYNRLRWFIKDVSNTVDDFAIDNRYKFLEIEGDKTVEEVHKEIISRLEA